MPSSPSLVALGKNPRVEAAFAAAHERHPEAVLARVIAERRGAWELATGERILRGEPSGRLRHEAAPGDLPAVGDWVACVPARDPGDEHATIHVVLPRTSVLRRGLAGGTTEAQIVATNVELVLVVSALDRDFNPRRFERYLVQITASGASPVIVLTKADACADADRLVSDARAVAGATEILVTSSVTGAGLAELRARIGEGTAALVGSSGVGKSSLTNALLGASTHLAVGATSADGRGRHTTTERGLFVLPGGGALVDTPGMRELRLFGDGEDLAGSFSDVETLAAECRFRDCGHEDEPDCRVREGLDEDRYHAYLKLKRELASFARRHDARARADGRKRHKVLARANRARDRS